MARRHVSTWRVARPVARVDLSQPDAGGSRLAVVLVDAGRLRRRTARRDSSRPPARAGTTPRPPAEGTGARDARPVQPTSEGRRYRVPSEDTIRSLVPADPTRHRVEPFTCDGRLWDREVGVDPADSVSARSAWRHGDRVRPGAGVHATVLHTGTRRRHS